MEVLTLSIREASMCLTLPSLALTTFCRLDGLVPGGRITGEAPVPTRRNGAVTLRGLIPPAVSPSPNHAPLQAAQLHPPALWTTAPARLETG